MSKELFTASKISKSFPGVQALSAVDFDLQEGEVHALVGENGAGKSTLARIIAGVETPDSGQMYLYGQQYRPDGPRHGHPGRVCGPAILAVFSRAGSPCHTWKPVATRRAEAQGVRMVMQELHLIANLTVVENIFIEKLPHRFGIIDYKRLNRAAREIMNQVGLDNVDPAAPVRSLGIGQQQMVEIAAGLSQRCQLLVLDEPTASLTDNEIELLFAQINKLKAKGVGIIYISHRIEEVMHIADRVTVLRDGNVVSTHPTKELNMAEIIRMMVGRDLQHESAYGGRAARSVGEVAFRVVGLTVGDKVKNVCFEVRQGEILGFAGLMGSGRTETMRALFGADCAEAGKIYLHGASQPVKIRKPRDAVRHGIAYLTEDRKQQGLFLPLPVRMNVTLTRLSNVSRLGWINNSKERSVAGKFVHALSVRCSSTEQAVGELSGGNQQKVVIAKWLYKDSDILIFDEPTRGIDVAAKFEIYHMLANLAEKGKVIIFVSSDLKELMAICDRIAVMSAGRLIDIFNKDEWSEEGSRSAAVQKIMSAAFSEYVRNRAESKKSLCQEQ
ncbi:MAG: sugar ABC transporter ATP-binding protein [Phycisphaerae bacterium]